LARQEGGFDTVAAFFDLVWQDPVMAQVKLIAEPWDVGQGDSYDVGRFPAGWSEWNGKFRDTVRDFWRSHEGLLPDLATRLTGSADLYTRHRRGPDAAVNLITVHDGFTLTDLVSYNDKHNEANMEQNRDGTSDNRSWNCGVEGPTTDAAILTLRARQRRAMLSTLLLSRGVPLLLGGDEAGRTQRGNNNAYCQDNAISWLDWSLDADRRTLLSFTQRLMALRAAHPVFRRRDFFQGRPLRGSTVRDIVWLQPDGTEMTAQEWGQDFARALAVFLAGDGLNEVDGRGRAVFDDSFLLLFNADANAVSFVIPADLCRLPGTLLLDTALPDAIEGAALDPARPYALAARALALIRYARAGAAR
jgi:glycogen operon protein